jgi:hypothetical protein
MRDGKGVNPSTAVFILERQNDGAGAILKTFVAPRERFAAPEMAKSRMPVFEFVIQMSMLGRRLSLRYQRDFRVGQLPLR